MRNNIIKIDLPVDILSKLELAGYSLKSLETMTLRQMALWLFHKGVLSFGRAAELAKMSKFEFMDFTRQSQIPLFDMDEEEVQESRKRVDAAAREIMNETHQ